MLPIRMYEFTTLELPIPELVSAADSSVPSLLRFKALLEGSVMMVGRMSLLLESWYCSIPRLRVGVGCGGCMGTRATAAAGILGETWPQAKPERAWASQVIQGFLQLQCQSLDLDGLLQTRHITEHQEFL